MARWQKVFDFCYFPPFQASHKKSQLSFYSIPEFNAWTESQANYKSWKIKYYKGLL